MTGFIDVTTMGIIPDGLSCCAQELEYVMLNMPKEGGTIYFPPGEYLFSRTVTVEKSGVSLLGAGVNATRFVSETPTHTYLSYGSAANQIINFSIRDICFNSRVSREDGSYLHLNNTFNGKIENCLFANPFIAVNVENSSFFYMSNCMVIDPFPGLGVGVLVHGNSRHNDQYFSKVFVQSQDRSAPCAAGFRFANSQALWMSQCGAYHCGIGVQIIATPGMTCEHMFFSENHADNSVGDGWVIEAGLQSTVRRIQFSGDWSASNGGRGWVIRGSGGKVDDISLLGARLYNNKGAGIFAENVGLLSIQNSTLASNYSKAENGSEIEFFGSIGAALIQGNRLGAISGYSTAAKQMIAGGASVRHLAVSGNVAVGFDKLCDYELIDQGLTAQNIKIDEV